MTAHFYLETGVLRFLLALRVHGSQYVRDIKLILLGMPLFGPNCVRSAFRKVRTTKIAVYEVRVPNQRGTGLNMRSAISPLSTFVVAALVRRLLVCHFNFHVIYPILHSLHVVRVLARCRIRDFHTHLIADIMIWIAGQPLIVHLLTILELSTCG